MVKPIFILLTAQCMIFLACCLGGCANDALSEESHAPDPNKSVVLLVLHLENRVKPEYQAWGTQIAVTNTQTGMASTFRFHPPETQVDNAYVEHLIALPVDPGQYTISQIDCGRDIVITQYSFTVNPNARFNAPPQSTSYIGCLQVVNRTPGANEKSSGNVWPLIGQSVSGYGSGINAVTITDHSQTDIAQFIKAYPFLESRKIDIKLMTNPAAAPK